jgi:hypothetical protein
MPLGCRHATRVYAIHGGYGSRADLCDRMKDASRVSTIVLHMLRERIAAWCSCAEANRQTVAQHCGLPQQSTAEQSMRGGEAAASECWAQSSLTSSAMADMRSYGSSATHGKRSAAVARSASVGDGLQRRTLNPM